MTIVNSTVSRLGINDAQNTKETGSCVPTWREGVNMVDSQAVSPASEESHKTSLIKLHSSQPLTADEFRWLRTFRDLNVHQRDFYGDVLDDIAKGNKVARGRLAPADRKPIAGKNVFALHRGAML